jgi:putative tryptophan/tyrosine transport system substrate-binding protein
MLSLGTDLNSTILRKGQMYRGAKPADLPVQAPTRYELIVNLRAAQALGLAISPSLLAAAHEVIE